MLQDGWYRTGDLGHQDEHGYLTITGRLNELIIRGGENIYPAEVEEVLLTHPNVRDAAVSSRADEALGEVPIAFVVAHDPGTFASTAVLDSCRSQLAEYKIPTAVHLVRAIPRTGSGKIRRHELPLSDEPEPAAATRTPATRHSKPADHTSIVHAATRPSTLQRQAGMGMRPDHGFDRSRVLMRRSPAHSGRNGS